MLYILRGSSPWLKSRFINKYGLLQVYNHTVVDLLTLLSFVGQEILEVEDVEMGEHV